MPFIDTFAPTKQALSDLGRTIEQAPARELQTMQMNQAKMGLQDLAKQRQEDQELKSMLAEAMPEDRSKRTFEFYQQRNPDKAIEYATKIFKHGGEISKIDPRAGAKYINDQLGTQLEYKETVGDVLKVENKATGETYFYNKDTLEHIKTIQTGLAPDKPKDFTLSPGQKRFSPEGKEIGTNPLSESDNLKGLEGGYRTFLKVNDEPNSPENYKKYQKQQVDQKREMVKATVDRPYMADLMSKGYIPTTRITAPMMDALEAGAKKASESGNPWTVQGLYDMEFQAQKNRSTGRTSGSRLVIARKQNIAAASGLLEDMKITSDKLNYPDIKFIGVLEKWKNGQLNDPIFTEYMTQRADALFVLGNALKQNGLTDKSIEVEEEAASPVLSPRAFDAWYNTQLRALNRAADEINKDYQYGLSMSPVFPAGQGGRPTDKNPEPSTSTETKNKIKFLGFE